MSISCICTAFSSSLPIVGSTEIGLQLEGSCLLPFLKRGDIFASFHVDGKQTVFVEILNNDVRLVAAISAASFNKRELTLSKPTALLG